MLARLKTWFRKLAGIDDPPEAIARGMALGIFVGFVPIMGIQMAAVLPLALLFRGNKVAAMAGVWVSNPLTVVPIYYVDYLVGLRFTSYGHVSWTNFADAITNADGRMFLSLGERLLVPLFLGGAVVGVLLSIPTYFVTRAMVARQRRRRGATSS